MARVIRGDFFGEALDTGNLQFFWGDDVIVYDILWYYMIISRLISLYNMISYDDIWWMILFGSCKWTLTCPRSSQWRVEITCEYLFTWAPRTRLFSTCSGTWNFKVEDMEDMEVIDHMTWFDAVIRSVPSFWLRCRGLWPSLAESGHVGEPAQGCQCQLCLGGSWDGPRIHVFKYQWIQWYVWLYVQSMLEYVSCFFHNILFKYV